MAKSTTPKPKTRVRKGGHGGARAGAGRPTFYPEPMKPRTVFLDDATVDIYKAIGGGNLSAGIRDGGQMLALQVPSGSD